ncbi:hypothetical protein [Ideonella sp.]|uniref:hypothetical protein n=1 Tax=Ideonella sp. TaxID=1929293 RepID=UPI003BB80B67
MPRTSFHPATLDLLPGESDRPPLRLLERASAPRPSAKALAPRSAPWLSRLRKIAERAFSA